MSLDAGLLAEVEALLDGWAALDELAVRTATALERADLAGWTAALRAGAVAHVVAARGVTGAHLATELRPNATDDPAAVAAWWDDLSGDERAALVRRDGARLRHVDGIPLDVRDRLNREVVADELARLRADVADDGWLRRNLGLPGVPDGWRDAHQDAAARIAALQRLAEADLVLVVDPRGDGRAVAAYGDPTTAAHVATVVPGISSHLGSLPTTLLEAKGLRDEALALRAGSVATIAWLDYDAPGGFGQRTYEILTQATHGGRARDGAPALSRFVAGLAAVRADGPAHTSVVGHSYGSRLLGEALRGEDLDVDDAIVVGSPGMGVDHASGLGLPPGTTLWAESSGEDRDDWWLPGGGDDPVAHAPGHGRNPDDPGFGARGFGLGTTTGHVAYLDAGSRSLHSISRIVVGDPPLPDTDDTTELAPGPADRLDPETRT